VDIVLGCVDNFEARITVNRACLELGLPWMESGVSENAMSGHIQFIKPGETACFECAPPLIVAKGEDEKTLKREGVCAASLPTTMSITAAFLIQNVLKYFLEFGEISNFLGYNALQNYFPTYTLKPNTTCANTHCVKAQADYQIKKANEPVYVVEPKKEVEVIHEDNSWGITLEASSDEIVQEEKPQKSDLPEGLQYRFDAPSKKMDISEFQVDTGGQSLDDLMKKLSNLY